MDDITKVHSEMNSALSELLLAMKDLRCSQIELQKQMDSFKDSPSLQHLLRLSREPQFRKSIDI